MARIRITGYTNTNSLDPEHVDLDHPSGLSELGHLELLSGESGEPLTLTDLTDVESYKA